MRRQLDSQEVQPGSTARKYSGWSLDFFFNPLKLRETLNIGVYGIFKIQDSSQLRKTLQAARHEGWLSGSQTAWCQQNMQAARPARQLGFGE